MTYDDALQIIIHDVVHPLSKHLKREDSSSTIVSMMVFPWNNFHIIVSWCPKIQAIYSCSIQESCWSNIPTYVSLNQLKIELTGVNEQTNVLWFKLTLKSCRVHDDTPETE